MDRRDFIAVIAAGVLSVPGDRIMIENKPTYCTGWVDRPDEVVKELSNLRSQGYAATFDETALHDEVDTAPNDVFGWLFVEKASGKPYVNKEQSPVGSCVSFGTNTAIEATEASEIVVRGDQEDWTLYTEEVTYGGSRVEIGKGQLGQRDGSTGVWAAKFVTQYGLVPRGVYGRYDLTTYNGNTCRAFGRSGVPSDLEAVARKYPVQSYVQVNNAAQAWKSIGNLNFIAVCSDVLFIGKRNADGVLYPTDRGGHCQCVIGRAVIRGNRYFFLQNSWAKTWIPVSGPIGYGNHPAGGGWIEYNTLDSMLRQGDSWAYAGIQGFAKKRIDWSAM